MLTVVCKRPNTFARQAQNDKIAYKNYSNS